MKKIVLFIFAVLGFSSIFAQNIPVLISNSSSETVISFKIDDFSYQTVQTPNGKEVIINAENGSNILEKGAPDLAKLTASIVIPDLGSSNIEIISSKYYDITDISVAPSKGNFTRDINPNDVPYTYGAAYQKDEFFPAKLADLNSPYIVRDLRGQAVNVYPFQYNPVTKTLRVYTEITVAVKYDNNTGVNEFHRTRSFNKVSYEFNKVYNSHFLNYQSITNRYTPVEEEGNMLIICYDDFTDEMADFVAWKNTIGRPTEMVALSTVGSSYSDIKTYVENYYNTNGLTYLLLVGDAEQVPTITSGLGGDSDNGYGYITGNDHYQEFFVGRFSASTADEVTTQVTRTLTYENGSSLATGWLSTVTGVTSALGDGQGDDGESDFAHYRNMATDLLGFTYTTSNEIFDGDQGGNDASGNATAAQVATALNAGSGLALYTGHGSDYSWVSSGFDVSDVNALTNAGKLPFIYSVACVNGNFVGQTCFAESWLRATDASGNATGAIAFLGSTINQSWAPPMIGQDEMIDILVESYNNNIKRSFDGIAVNGMFQMLDESSDNDMADTWTCFGDPSLMIRTADPANMTISHEPTIIVGTSSFTVNCDFNGALACLSKDGEILGTAKVSGGTATITLTSTLTPGDQLKLAVTGFNKVTYLSDITVSAANEPYIVISGSSPDTVDYNKTVKIDVSFKNVADTGYDVAGATATISTTDPYVTIIDSTATIGNITGGQTVNIEDAFTVYYYNCIEDQHIVNFTITTTGNDAKYTWTSKKTVVVNAPDLQGEFSSVKDTSNNITFSSSAITNVNNNAQYTYNISVTTLGGNNNGLLDAGENVELFFKAKNIGHASIKDTYGHLSTTCQYITINNPDIYIDSIVPNGNFIANFNIEVDTAAPVGTLAEFKFTIGNVHYNDTLSQNLPIGLVIENFETGDLSAYNWITGGDATATVVSTNPYEGNYCVELTNPGDNNTTTLSINLNGVSAGQKMSFYYKVSSEEDYDKFTFNVDGSPILAESGEVAWTQYEHTFTTAGDYVISFDFSRDCCYDGGSNTAWIDYIVFPTIPSKSRSAKSITITGNIPSWTTLTDNGDGTAILSGTAPNNNRTDDVVLTASNGTNTVTQKYTIHVGVTSIVTNDNVVRFFPNPVTDYLTIQLDNTQNTEITILSTDGKIIINQQITNNQTQIDLSNFAKGIYILNLNINGKIVQNKIIIN